MDDLKTFSVPAHPLGRRATAAPDILRSPPRARDGLYTGLSTNGTLIDAPWRSALPRPVLTMSASASMASKPTHDKFRRLEGAFDRSLAAIGHLDRVGVKVGLRFTP